LIFNKTLIYSFYIFTDNKYVRFFKIKSNAIAPRRGTIGSCGYDIASIDDVDIEPFERKAINTGFKIQLPIGTYGRLASRSGLALNHSIDVAGGVIDSDYRGEIIVILCNNGKTKYSVKKGDRIAQLIIEKYLHCKTFTDLSLSETSRGENGFGSTGV
jgi:dUTP pyrophosphatase